MEALPGGPALSGALRLWLSCLALPLHWASSFGWVSWTLPFWPSSLSVARQVPLQMLVEF